MSSGRFTYFVVRMAMYVFSYGFTSIAYAGNAIPFGFLHSTYIRRPHDLNDMLLFVCMLSLFRCFAGSIAGSYAGSCSRTSRGATHFPNAEDESHVAQHLRRSLYISEDLCITTPGEQTHIPRISLYNIPSRSLDKVEFTLQLPYHSA